MCCFPDMIGQLRDQFVEQLRTETPICRICLPGSISGISSTCQNRALAVAASGRLHHGLSNGLRVPFCRFCGYINSKTTANDRYSAFVLAVPSVTVTVKLCA